MYSIAQMLTAAGVSSSEWPKGFGVIRLTAGHQLIGTYAELMKYRNANPEYQGWEIHHILEALDIERLGLAAFSPAYEDQICVLIPAPAHHRINSVLRRANPTKLSATVPELEAAYRDAYKIIGNYCGSSEAAVSQELFGLFKAVLSNLVAAETDARSTQINNAVFALQVLENKIAAGRSLHEKLIRGMTPSTQEKMIFAVTAPFIGELAIFTAAGQAVVGKAVNKVNPVPRPPMSIWVKAEVSAQRARRALARGDLGEAGSDIVLADTHFRIADDQITAWRNGIDLAGRKAQLGIGASAVVASIVAISVFAPDVPAVVGTGVRVAEQTPTGVRIAAEVERGVRVVLLAQTSAEEQVGEAIITEEVPKLLLQALPLPK